MKNRKIIIFICIAIAAYLYWKNKNAAAAPLATAAPYDKDVLNNLSAAALDVTVEEAAVIEEERAAVEKVAETSSEAAPVTEISEQLHYNGKAYPIVGYGLEGSKQQTLVFIPVQYAKDFVPDYDGGIKSTPLSIGSVTIIGGGYAGTHTAWYAYINDRWALPRMNLYIDAAWKG
jgi:hypothetical protein